MATTACASDDKDIGTASTASGAAPKVRYAYDPLGRLVQAASFDGTAVQYSYDAVGNITSIRRLAPGTLRVVDFTPPSGTIGSTVAVFGSGFSASASENTVAFNGTAVTVTSATETALTVTVPVGATTGKITVTNAAGSATSSTDYMVLSSSLAPGIASFTPALGTQGTVISITGVNFQTGARDNNVSVGGQLAEVVQDASSPAPALLKVRVPSTTASGRIEVTTEFGRALSSDEFFALPTTVVPTDVEATGRVTVNGPALARTTTTAGKKIVLVFDAQVGQRLHLIATDGTFTAGVMVDVYGAAGTKLQTLSMNNNSVGDFTVPVPASGTHTIVINPSASDKGSLRLSMVADATGAMALEDSTAVSLVSGQNAHLSFAAQANTGLGLALAGLTFAPSGGTPSVTATLRKADGTSLITCTFTSNNSCDLGPTNFATTGTYFLDFDPSGLIAAGFNAVLSSDASGSLTIDAPPTTVTIARAGQNARYAFAGTAGQAVTVMLTGNTIDDGNSSTTNGTQILVFKPSNNASALASDTISTHAAGLTLDLTLPETGTYALAIRPSGLDSGSINAQLTSFATGSLVLDGSTPVALASGQNARFSFTAQASTGYGLALTSLAFTPSSGTPPPSLTATLRKVDGTQLTTCAFSVSTSCDFEPTSFATTGTYFLDFDPSGLVAASFNAVLSTDARGTVTVDAETPTAVAIARPGQNARYSLSGTAGQVVSVVFTSSTLDDGNTSTPTSTLVQVFRPNGSLIASNNFNASTGGVTLDTTLPDTATYTIVIKPSGLDAGTVNLAVKSPATGALTLDGSTAVNLGPGQNGRFSFTAQAGTGYGLALTDLAFTPSVAVPSPSVTATLRKADGTSLTTCSFTSSNSCDLSATSFTTAATYFLELDPNGTVAAHFNVVLSTDLSGTIVVDAPPTPITFARAGQNARINFSGTAGQLVRVVVSGNALDDGNGATVNNTQMLVFKPSSPNTGAIGSVGFNTGVSSATINLTLPETGSYAIAIKPSGLDSGSLNLGVAFQ
ncbi:MAG TPA: IPT/TIG domain-containing protein [Kofleriaceae bacterium]|nr:IPT/TIG domain-containing protein [Kofleriaceae bacterium]